MSQADRLESALQRSEAEVDAALKAAAAATRSLKRLRAVVHDGNLRELRATLSAAREAAEALQQEVATTAEHWDLDETAYFADGAYTRELLEAAAHQRVRIFEQDEQLYCYPSLIRLLPSERTLLIDRTRERRLRPSVVVEHLRSLQEQPPRFHPQAFLETLFKAYRVLVQRHGSAALERASVERLSQVYDLLTLLPGQSRDYSRQEFARDLYLLDRSGMTRTRDGFVVSFPGSTGPKSASGVITAITETGRERRYWGIAFTREN